MPRSPMSPIFNHTNWDTVDIGIDNSVHNTSDTMTSNNTLSGYRYVPANLKHAAPNTTENDDAISRHTDLFPLPPTYSQFHPPYTPSPNYHTFPSLSPTNPDNDSSSDSDCYSDHLDLDSYLAPSPTVATAPVFPSFTNSHKSRSHKKYQPRAPPSLTFFPRPSPAPKMMPSTRPVHQSRHLSTLSAKMPLLPVHHRYQPPAEIKTDHNILTSVLGAFTTGDNKKECTSWYHDELEEELEITPSLVQGLDLESEKLQYGDCQSSWWCVFQFLVMVLLGFVFLGVMFLAGKTLWELGWEVVAWMHGNEAAVEGVVGGRLCSDAHPRFCHLVVGAER
ncbi:hypothetical protein QC761_0095640 [Podospora bellae-mahoneyi]|uniref:Uncharacterized protein n=1 Tax=Podospora bellae-mahoneyi TaxID=2093777 RepID=A0ABR0F9Y0_9PEZI|nr:hypothetical protein QC761_0095640 [Podospora bellae-mahoneyi]